MTKPKKTEFDCHNPRCKSKLEETAVRHKFVDEESGESLSRIRVVERVLYCPRCEKRPSESGYSIFIVPLSEYYFKNTREITKYMKDL